MNKGIVSLLIIITILIVPVSTIGSDYKYNSSTIHKYGPIKIYFDDSVTVYMFDEEYFNYTYRNVYVYITNNIIINDEDKIPKLYDIVDEYFSVNPYEINIAKIGIQKEEQTIADYFNEKIGYPIVEGIEKYGNTFLIIIKNTRSIKIDELIKIGKEIAVKYNGKVEIVEMSPFEDFFNGKYNASSIASEAMKIVEENNLMNTVIGIGKKIPAFKIYAVLELDKDMMNTIAESKHMSLNRLIKEIIDKLREKIPEEIPLSIIIKKRSEIKFLDDDENNEIRGTSSDCGILQWILIGIPVIILSIIIYRFLKNRKSQ